MSNNYVSPQTAGTVVYEFPVRVAVDLDADDTFRGFDARQRHNAMLHFADLLAALANRESMDTVDVSVNGTVALVEPSETAL